MLKKVALPYLRRIRYNYYMKKLIENSKNRALLSQARIYYKKEINKTNPLVSVTIPTYNRADILMNRSIPSVLRQTHTNFEIIIVGDHCTDDTEARIKKMKDKRIKFLNLPEAWKYPSDLDDMWLILGTIPRNRALELCTGDWIAPLDDDDEFSDDHIEVLLNHALKHDLEMVYGKVQMERESGEWIELGSYPLECGRISHLSVLYHSKLKFFKYDINSWKYCEPNDWDLWRRMRDAGVRIGFVDKFVGKHYLEGTLKTR